MSVENTIAAVFIIVYVDMSVCELNRIDDDDIKPSLHKKTHFFDFENFLMNLFDGI